MKKNSIAFEYMVFSTAEIKKQLELYFNKSEMLSLVFLILWTVTMYMLPNKFHLKEPTNVPITTVDQMVSLSTHWIWPYISYYFFIFGTYLFVRSETVKKQIFLSYLGSTLMSCFIFFTFPTAVPRELYPLLEVAHVSDWVLSLIRYADISINCFPSMHVAMSLIAALAMSKEWPRLKWVALIWFMLIAYSTMATKQHYFYDVVGGLVYGAFWWATAKKAIDFNPISEYLRYRG